MSDFVACSLWYLKCNIYLLRHMSQLLLSTAWPHKISEQVLSSHSVVSSPRIVRPCSPWRSQWIGHWRTTWSTACFSAASSQAAEGAIPHFCKQERKRPTPVWRRLSQTNAVPGMTIPGACRCWGWKYGVW